MPKASKRELTGISVILGVYIGLTFWSASQELFLSIGRDYFSFWGTTYLALQKGWHTAFDVQALAQIQLPYLPEAQTYLAQGGIYVPPPAPYLPVFFLPFYLIVKFPPAVGYVIWGLAKVLLAGSYWRLWQQRGVEIPWLYFFVSYPFFADLYWGNWSFILLIIIGEILYGLWQDKETCAGAWLGMLWLKPSLLPFVFLYLLLAAKQPGRILRGWLLATVILWGASILLAGTTGIEALFRLILSLMRSPLPGLGLKGAMNWRALVLNSETYSQNLGLFVSALGLLLSLYWGTRLIARIRQQKANGEKRPDALALYFLIVLSFAFTFSNHAHIHYLLGSYIPLAVGLQSAPRQEKQLYRTLLRWLVFGFTGVWLLIMPLNLVARLLSASPSLIEHLSFLLSFIPFAGSALLFNLYTMHHGLKLHAAPEPSPAR